MELVRPKGENLLGVEQFPDAEGFGGGPGLGVAAAMGVRGVAIHDFRQLAQAAFPHQAPRATITPQNPAATDVAFQAETTHTLTSPWTTNEIVIDQNTPTLFQAHNRTPVGASTNGFIRLNITRP